tara:strand:+ start:1260 stop:1709 length:450 start_codon:yes stop_codon:yes gene_type:complete
MKKKSQLNKVVFTLLVIIIIVARYAPNPNGTSIHNHSDKPYVSTQQQIQLNPSSITTEAEMEEILNHLNRDIPSKTTKTSKSTSSSNDLDNYNKMIDKINADSEAEYKKSKQRTTDALNSWKEMDYSVDDYDMSYEIDVVDTYYRNDKQ